MNATLHVRWIDGRSLDSTPYDADTAGAIAVRLAHDPTVKSVWVEDETAPEPAQERVFGGWVHRAIAGTLPTFARMSTAHAYLPEKETR